MRLCANENIPEDCVVRLRERGHDVLWIREAAPGGPDPDVLARALTEDRLLITFDKDFGELVLEEARKPRVASFCSESHSLLRQPWLNELRSCLRHVTIGLVISASWMISRSA